MDRPERASAGVSMGSTIARRSGTGWRHPCAPLVVLGQPLQILADHEDAERAGDTRQDQGLEVFTQRSSPAACMRIRVTSPGIIRLPGTPKRARYAYELHGANALAAVDEVTGRSRPTDATSRLFANQRRIFVCSNRLR